MTFDDSNEAAEALTGTLTSVIAMLLWMNYIWTGVAFLLATAARDSSGLTSEVPGQSSSGWILLTVH